MTPETALAEQIGRYRQMTGEQRLAIALDLHEHACEIAREGIRAQYPGASPEQIEERLYERIKRAGLP